MTKTLIQDATTATVAIVLTFSLTYLGALALSRLGVLSWVVAGLG